MGRGRGAREKGSDSDRTHVIWARKVRQRERQRRAEWRYTIIQFKLSGRIDWIHFLVFKTKTKFGRPQMLFVFHPGLSYHQSATFLLFDILMQWPSERIRTHQSGLLYIFLVMTLNILVEWTLGRWGREVRVEINSSHSLYISHLQQ